MIIVVDIFLKEFFASNISTVNLILRMLESHGVVRDQSFIITSSTFYHDWLMSEIDKRISRKNYVSFLRPNPKGFIP
jgi:hypothetical protein